MEREFLLGPLASSTQILSKLGQILLPLGESHAHHKEVPSDLFAPTRLADESDVLTVPKFDHKRHSRLELLRFLQK